MPHNSDDQSQALFFLNPLSSWSENNTDTFNQLVNLETYQRLVKQEFNDNAMNNTAANVKDHFQNYHHHLSTDDSNELKVFILLLYWSLISLKKQFRYFS